MPTDAEDIDLDKVSPATLTPTILHDAIMPWINNAKNCLRKIVDANDKIKAADLLRRA